MVFCFVLQYVSARPGSDKKYDQDYDHEHEHEPKKPQPPHEHDKDCGHPIKDGIDKMKTIIQNAVKEVKETVKETAKNLIKGPPSPKPDFGEKEKPIDLYPALPKVPTYKESYLPPKINE